jgi:hypothetical protein
MATATLTVSAAQLISLNIRPSLVRQALEHDLARVCGHKGEVRFRIDPSCDYYYFFVDSPNLVENTCLKLDENGRIVAMTGIARAIDILRRMK